MFKNLLASHPRFVAIAALLFSMVSIQTGASFAKLVFPLAGLHATVMLRLVFAALILCAIWRPWRLKLTRSQIHTVLIYGAALGAMNFLFYLSLARIPLGIVVAIEFTGPLSVALFASRKPQDFICVALALAGIVLLLPVHEAAQPLDLLGIIYALGAGACWALYILFGQKSVNALPGGTAIALGMTIGALVVLPFGLAEMKAGLFSPHVLLIVFGVAILSSALPYTLEMLALKNMPAKTFGILMSLEPVFAALSGFLYLDERLTLMQWAAIACVIAASAGSTRSTKATVTPEIAV